MLIERNACNLERRTKSLVDRYKHFKKVLMPRSHFQNRTKKFIKVINKTTKMNLRKSGLNNWIAMILIRKTFFDIKYYF